MTAWLLEETETKTWEPPTMAAQVAQKGEVSVAVYGAAVLWHGFFGNLDDAMERGRSEVMADPEYAMATVTDPNGRLLHAFDNRGARFDGLYELIRAKVVNDERRKTRR